MKVTCAVAIAIAIAVQSAPAQTKHSLTHELLWSFHRVGVPSPSPDGKWVVFSVTEPSYDEKESVTDLSIVPADGTEKPRRLTSSKGGESAPAWSPDSARLAFAARRNEDEVTQIYVLDVARGGDAQRITSAPTAATAPRWSPDGKRLVFQAPMWPGATDEASNRKAAQEQKDAKSKARIYDAFPIRLWDKWIDRSKGHVWIVDVDGDRTAKSLLAGTGLAVASGFLGDALSPVWAPDGQSIVFAASDVWEKSTRANLTSYLWQVGLKGGEPKRLTPNTWSVGPPAFRPDGRSICFQIADTKPAIYQITRLGCAAWPWSAQSSIEVLTRDFDRDIDTWAFSPDSRTVFFTAPDSGHQGIHSVPAAGGAVQAVIEAKHGVYIGLAVPQHAARTVLFANWESAVNPAEVVRVDPSSGGSDFLSAFNTSKAAAIDWRPLREFWFNGRNGRRIHSFLALPPNFDETKKYPLFVLIHGGHASMWTDAITYRWNYHLLAEPEFVVLLTDYRGSVGYGEQFTLDILGDPLAGPADDLNDAADEAIKRFPFIDGTRQAAGGASYGGHLANWLAVTTTRYKALVSHAGLATLDMQWGTSDFIYHREVMMGAPYWDNPLKWIEQSPLARAGNLKTPMLLSVGENDFRVPEGNTLAMYAALQRMNVPSRLIVWPDENHWILKGENSRVFYREVRAWLEKYVLQSTTRGTP